MSVLRIIEILDSLIMESDPKVLDLGAKFGFEKNIYIFRMFHRPRLFRVGLDLEAEPFQMQ